VTLADVKAGDFVRGQGDVKNSVFVAKVLTAGQGRGPRREAPAPSLAPPQVAPPQEQGQTAPNVNGPTN
jgi:hypothetical protein